MRCRILFKKTALVLTVIVELVPSLLHVGSADMGGTAMVVRVFSSSSDEDLVADCALTP